MEPRIEITQREYDQLIKRSLWIDALDCAGVDNWDGCEEAMRIMDEWNKEEDSYNELRGE